MLAILAMILFIRTHGNIDLVYFTSVRFITENYATFTQELNSDFIVQFILVQYTRYQTYPDMDINRNCGIVWTWTSWIVW